jgi:hypothetical protein
MAGRWEGRRLLPAVGEGQPDSSPTRTLYHSQLLHTMIHAVIRHVCLVPFARRTDTSLLLRVIYSYFNVIL